MYRLLLESLLGITREVDRLRIDPHLPSDWPFIRVHYRFRDTLYHITIRQSEPSCLAIYWPVFG